MRALFIMHYSEMGTMIYYIHILQVLVCKVFLWTGIFWISYIKWYKFYNNNLSVVLGTKQGARWNFWTPSTRIERQFNCWPSLSLSFYWVTESLLNCTWGQLNNEGGGELNEIKRSRDKTEIGKETRGRSKRTSSQKWQFLDPLRPCHH